MMKFFEVCENMLYMAIRISDGIFQGEHFELLFFMLLVYCPLQQFRKIEAMVYTSVVIIPDNLLWASTNFTIMMLTCTTHH